MYLKMTPENENLIEEISAISGYNKDVIREIWEFTFFNWLVKIASNPLGLNKLDIPFLGSIAVRYLKDTVNSDGTLSTEVESFISLDALFKKYLGDIVDGDDKNLINEVLQKKIDNSILSMTSKI